MRIGKVRIDFNHYTSYWRATITGSNLGFYWVASMTGLVGYYHRSVDKFYDTYTLVKAI